MAKAKAQGGDKDEEPGGGGGMGQLIVAVVLAILLGAGSGAALGFIAPFGTSQPAATPADADHATTPAAAPGRFPFDAMEIQLEPIIVDLVSQQKTMVRLDLSIIAAHGTPQGSPLKAEIREDVIAFMKGLSISDIAGVRGFQNLRQQLEDRAKVRGRGAILGLLIGGMAVQ